MQQKKTIGKDCFTRGTRLEFGMVSCLMQQQREKREQWSQGRDRR